MDNKNKIILDLCGGTGSWSKPFKESGFDVRVITLPEFDILQTELKNDGICFRNASHTNFMIVPYHQIYGILAAPPCTEFSLAKTTAPRNLNLGMETVKACMNIIWKCQSIKQLRFWALENPVGLLRKFLGRPQFTFCQWEYGGIFYKKTDLWGFYNVPRKTVFERPHNLTKRFPGGSCNSTAWNAPKCPEEYKNMGLKISDIRAITPAGFAEAFYRANAV